MILACYRTRSPSSKPNIVASRRSLLAPDSKSHLLAQGFPRTAIPLSIPIMEQPDSNRNSIDQLRQINTLDEIE